MDKKMAKCRNCTKEVEVEKLTDIEFIHECGWNEAKAKAEARKRKLLREIEEEETKADKDKNKDKDKEKQKSIFGF